MLNQETDLISGNKTRRPYIDIAKAILIICIVLGHSGSPFTSFIYLFHVAGFILISGYLFNSACMNFWTHLCKRLRGLWGPYVGYQLIYLCFYNLMVRIGIYAVPMITSLKDYAVRFINILLLGNASGDMAGAMWFIALLFEVSLLYALIHILTSRLKYGEWIKGIVVFCLFIGGYLLLKFGYQLPRYTDTTLLVLPVYYIGTLYRKYEHKVPMHIGLFLLSVAALLVLNRFGSVSLSDKNITNPAFFLVVTIAGTYAVIYLSWQLSKISIGKIFEYIGKFTFDIMALHFLVFKLVTFVFIVICGLSMKYLASFPTIENSGWLWIVYTVVGIALPIGIKALFVFLTTPVKNRIRPLRILKGGGKS